jgi:hypothetical protein
MTIAAKVILGYLARPDRWLCIVLFGLVACSAHSVPYVVLDSGISGGRGSANPRFDVVTDSETFKRVFTEIHPGQFPIPTPPDVDFTRSLVVLAMLDEKPTAGYSLRIVQISQHQRTLLIEVRVDSPPSDRALATVITQPYTLVRVDRPPVFDTVQFVGDNQQVLQTISLKKPQG